MVCASNSGAHCNSDVICGCLLVYFCIYYKRLKRYILFACILGQVQKLIEEENCEEDHQKMTHITIPAAYSSGITLFALRDSSIGQELLCAPELPLLWFNNLWTSYAVFGLIFSTVTVIDYMVLETVNNSLYFITNNNDKVCQHFRLSLISWNRRLRM